MCSKCYLCTGTSTFQPCAVRRSGTQGVESSRLRYGTQKASPTGVFVLLHPHIQRGLDVATNVKHRNVVLFDVAILAVKRRISEKEVRESANVAVVAIPKLQSDLQQNRLLPHPSLLLRLCQDRGR